MRKAGTQSHYRVDNNRSLRRASKGETPRDAAKQNRFQRDMVDNIGPLRAVELRDSGNRVAGASKPVAAPAPADRVQVDAFLPDSLAMRPDPSRDRDLEARSACCASDGQPVRTEIPILGHEEEKLRPTPCPSCYERRRARLFYDVRDSHSKNAKD
jgi:hypothetical protein